jgi:hypothetical protein
MELVLHVVIYLEYKELKLLATLRQEIWQVCLGKNSVL